MAYDWTTGAEKVVTDPKTTLNSLYNNATTNAYDADTGTATSESTPAVDGTQIVGSPFKSPLAPPTPPKIPNPYALPGVTSPSNPNLAAPQFANPYGGGWQGFTGATIANPGAPTASQLSFMGSNGQATANPNANPFAQAQLGNIQQLQGIANGAPGSSLAEMQAQQTGAQNLASTYALANSSRQNNPAVLRGALQQGAVQGAQNQQAAVQARQAEQLNAAGLIGQVAGQGQQTAVDVAKSNAALTQEAGIAGYQGQLQKDLAQGQIDQDTAKSVYTAAQNAGLSQLQAESAYQDLQSKYAQMGMTGQVANQQAALDLEKLIQSGALGSAQINAQQQSIHNQMLAGLLGAGAGAVATYYGGPAAGVAAGTVTTKAVEAQPDASGDTSK